MMQCNSKEPLKSVWINPMDIARRLPTLLREVDIDFGNSDKIFSSQWLSESKILIGSKCNKVKNLWRYLAVMNVNI